MTKDGDLDLPVQGHVTSRRTDPPQKQGGPRGGRVRREVVRRERGEPADRDAARAREAQLRGLRNVTSRSHVTSHGNVTSRRRDRRRRGGGVGAALAAPRSVRGARGAGRGALRKISMRRPLLVEDTACAAPPRRRGVLFFVSTLREHHVPEGRRISARRMRGGNGTGGGGAAERHASGLNGGGERCASVLYQAGERCASGLYQAGERCASGLYQAGESCASGLYRGRGGGAHLDHPHQHLLRVQARRDVRRPLRLRGPRDQTLLAAPFPTVAPTRVPTVHSPPPSPPLLLSLLVSLPYTLMSTLS